mgnify:CR=1 FL=1
MNKEAKAKLAKRIQNTLDSLCDLGGVAVFGGLFTRKNSTLKLRIWTLKAIGMILQHSGEKRRQRMLEGWGLSRLHSHLLQYPFTESVYFVLMELLLLNVSNDKVQNPLENYKDKGELV